MGKETGIAWCDSTWNPWLGCTKVSQGCKHCYAETLMDTRWQKVQWGPQGERIRTSDANWRLPLRWNQQAIDEGRRYRVFCGSLCDVFEDKPNQREQLSAWRKQLFELITATPNLDWLLLTKRPELVMTPAVTSLFPKTWQGQLLENIWIGTSVEDQESADKRIPELIKIPAEIRFLSVEPLLGPVMLDNGESSWLSCNGHSAHDECCESFAVYGDHFHGIDWVILGGESGPGARYMHRDWLQSVMQQCRDSRVRVFVKQLGSVLAKELGLKHSKGGELAEWPADLRVRQFPLQLPSRADVEELAAAWPGITEDMRDGVDRFAHYPVAGAPKEA